DDRGGGQAPFERLQGRPERRAAGRGRRAGGGSGGAGGGGGHRGAPHGRARGRGGAAGPARCAPRRRRDPLIGKYLARSLQTKEGRGKVGIALRPDAIPNVVRSRRVRSTGASLWRGRTAPASGRPRGW